MKNRYSSLRRKLLEDLLGERVEEYENFSKSSSTISKKKHRQLIPLWKFILHLLHRDVDSTFVEWSEAHPLQFQIKDPGLVAELWGSMKNRSDMNYEKLGRAMRYYYGKGIIEKVSRKRYSYRFILSKKTEKCISEFMEVDGINVCRGDRRPLSSDRVDDAADDDSGSVSSSTSNKSDDSSVCFAPDLVDNEDKERDGDKQDDRPRSTKSISPKQISSYQIPVSSTIANKPVPTKAPQLNTSENQIIKIQKSNVCLLPEAYRHVSAFSPPKKAKLDDVGSDGGADTEGYDQLDRSFMSSKHLIKLLFECSCQGVSNCDPSMMDSKGVCDRTEKETLENTDHNRSKNEEILDGLMRNTKKQLDETKKDINMLSEKQVGKEASCVSEDKVQLDNMSNMVAYQTSSSKSTGVELRGNEYLNGFHQNNTSGPNDFKDGIPSKFVDNIIRHRRDDPFMGCVEAQAEFSVHLLNSYSTLHDV